MKSKRVNIVLYLLMISVYYILPFISSDKNYQVLLILMAYPAASMLLSLIYALMNGFKVHFTFFVMLAFVPIVYWHYNDSSLIYVPIYGVFSVVGQALGWVLFKNRRGTERRKL